MVAVTAVALAMPLLASAHDDEFESDWGWIDDAPQVEEYDFQGGDVSVDMAAPGTSVSFETFQDGLTPYGSWVSVGAYGRVWRPAGVAAGWRPYYNGRWEWTDEGWLWVSAEPWGWATYHYGRWAYDSFYGWVWVPGYQWAPAWVSWRYGPDYIGWAPLGPGLSVYVTNYPVVYNHWCFVPSARFVGVPVHSVAVVGPHVAPIYTRTQPAPPRATVHGSVAPAWGGPARPFVERRVGRPIAPVRVQPVASPAAAAAAPSRGGVVQVYRPEATRPSRSGAATRSGAAATPGRSNGNALVAPGRSDADRATPSRGNSGAAAPAPARPGSSTRLIPPIAEPSPSSSSSSDSVQRGGSRGGSSSRDSSAVAPPSRGGGSGRSASAAPPRSSGGGSGQGGGGGGQRSSSGGGGHGGGQAPPRR
jgi:hypothetical protein